MKSLTIVQIFTFQGSRAENHQPLTENTHESQSHVPNSILKTILPAGRVGVCT